MSMAPTYHQINPGAQRYAGGHRNAFFLMAKAPRVGSVKTRLVPPLTPEEAAELSRCFIRDMTANIAAVIGETEDVGGIAFTPTDDAAAFDGLLPEGFALLAQRGAHLGERLFHATEDLLAAGFSSICLINADSPNLPGARLAEAAILLRQAGDRVVLGEADDGGYYLIGLKRAHARLFERIDWSTERVFGQSLARAAEIGLAVARLAIWYDIDDSRSLRRFQAEPTGHLSGYAAPATRALLKRLTLTNAELDAVLAKGADEARLA
jgi:rSAM/selenodomain-associated transferase 1